MPSPISPPNIPPRSGTPIFWRSGRSRLARARRWCRRLPAALLLLSIPLSGTAQRPAPEMDPAPAPTGQTRQVDNGIAAVVEDRIITYREIRTEAARLVEQVRRASRTEQEFHQRMRELEEEIVQSMVDRVLIVKAFDERGYRIPDSFIEHEINEILVRDFDGDRSRLLRHLRDHGMSMRDFREDTREEIIVRYMRSQMRQSEAVVSPVRIEEFYRDNPERFQRDESIYLRLIQLTADTPEALDNRIDTVMRALEDGEAFADVAREHSRDRRAPRGGSWGWLNVSDLREDWRQVASALDKESYSDPIDAGPSGVYILYVEDRREAGLAPLQEVREEIEEILVSRMARDSQERWLERLRRDAFVRYF